MPLPLYFLPRPEMPDDAGTIAAFDKLYAEQVEPGTGAAISYRLSAPKWQFLCYVCDTKNVVLHGSGNNSIGEFEPRQSNDVTEFGNRQAVYAASDGIWPMYFAIVDRDGRVKSLMNACFRLLGEDGTEGEPYYFFSINADALPHRPWRKGTVYILPRSTFEQQEPSEKDGRIATLQQWASLVPVKPLAKLEIEPEDFPFLEQIRPHDVAYVQEAAQRDPHGFPWLQDPSEA